MQQRRSMDYEGASDRASKKSEAREFKQYHDLVLNDAIGNMHDTLRNFTDKSSNERYHQSCSGKSKLIYDA